MKTILITKRKDLLISLAIGIFIFFYIHMTTHLVGFVRDEGFYMKAASITADWFEFMEKSFAKGNVIEPFSRKSIDKYFKFNNEHPAFMKTLFGFSQYVFERKLGWMSFAESARFVGALFAMFTAVFIYFFGLLFFNRFTAVVAPFFFFMMPHIFFHSHLACFDIPILFFWSAIFFLYALHLRSGSISTAICTAVFLGFAMASKHNAFFIPVLFFVSWIIFYMLKYRKERQCNWFRKLFISVPKVFYMFVFITIPVYFISWPWIWYDSIKRFGSYLAFHTLHVNYTNYYFGTELARPPFPINYPFGMTFFTTPLPQLLFFIAGIIFFTAGMIRCRDWKEKESNGLMLAGALFPIILIAIPSVPIFGGIKHWFTGYPLMMTAGIFVISEEIRRFCGENEIKQKLIPAVIFVVALTAIVPLNIKFAKRGAAFYNEFIDGAQGAAELRMQRNFWGYDILELVGKLNGTAPEGSTVYVMGGYEGLNWNSFLYLKKEGIIREDINGTNTLRNADYAFFFYEKQNEHMLNEISAEFGTAKAEVLSQTDSVFYSALFRREK